jgi:TolB protein
MAASRHSRFARPAAAGALAWLSACGAATEPRGGAAPALVFTAFGPVAGSSGQLHVTDARGAALRVFGARTILYQGTVSPDGRRVASTASEWPSPVQGIYVMHADGSDRRRISPAEGHGYSPAWSPDGARLAFIYDGSPAVGGRGVYVVAADGSGLRRVGAPDAQVGRLDWSPDGTHLAVATGRHPQRTAITILSVADGAERPLRTPGDCGDSGPTWSPDGARIALATCALTPADPREAQVAESRIVVLGRDGTGETTIATVLRAQRPAWSPDGRWIAFEGVAVTRHPDRPPTASMEVHVVADTGGAARVVTGGNPGEDGRPQWLASGVLTR